MARDLYDVLGVGRDADAETIKRAYRSRARELHPDVSVEEDAGERFHEVSEAYAVLSDEESRRLYDRLGWRGRGRAWTPRPGTARVYASNPRAFVEDVETILKAAVGRRRGKRATHVVAEVEIDPYEAQMGTTRTILVEQPRPCRACGGEGRRVAVSDAESGRFVALDDCPECKGARKVRERRRVDVTLAPLTRDLDRVPVGGDAVAVVRIVRPRDSVAIRLVASAVLLVAVGFLLYLLTI